MNIFVADVIFGILKLNQEDTLKDRPKLEETLQACTLDDTYKKGTTIWNN